MQQTEKSVLSDDVRKQNKLRILRAFRRTGTFSRTELARETRLSPGTITNITTQFIAESILTLVGPNQRTGTRHGRPQVQLALNPSHASIVSGSLSFGRLMLEYRSYDGKNVSNLTHDFRAEGKSADDIAAEIAALVWKVTGGTWPEVISIGVQGTTTRDGTRILWSPILSEQALGFPSSLSDLSQATVLVNNDCAAVARALEHRQAGLPATFGAILMSYGIGMGLYVNGSIFGGGQSSATEFGHIPYRPSGAQCRCGKKGCIEAYASDYAIWRAASGMDESLLPRSPVTPEMIGAVVERARAGEGPERAALREASRALGIGLATVFTLFDPFPVVFIGPGSALVRVMEDELRQTLRENFRFRQRPRLTFQTEADETSLIEEGARIIALDRLDRIAAYGA